MKKKQWNYKISSGLTGVVLSFFMFAFFTAIMLWLYTSKNEAFIFGVVLSLVMFTAFLATVYRAIFYKVLIGKDGLYYQSNHNNGKYYDYIEIEKAWKSTGSQLNGYISKYCNYETNDGKTIRFPYYAMDTKGIAYLLKRVKEKNQSKPPVNHEDNYNYKINGKYYGKSRIIIASILLIIVTILEIYFSQYKQIQFSFLPAVIIALIILIILSIQYFYFNIQISKTGFYFQTNPFNKQYYNYSDIESCKEIMKIYKQHTPRQNSSRIYYFYFIFIDKNGKSRKFQFEKPIYEYEVNVLKARIENAKKL